MTTTVINRDDAVHRIADVLADRTEFVVAVPPAAVDDVIDRLRRLPAGWTAYVDAGLPTVLVSGEPAVAALLQLAGPTCAVITVPKTVPARRLAAVLGTQMPADGSRDVVLVGASPDGPAVWPLLFVDAIDVVEPAAAAQIRANDLRSAS